MDVAMQTHSEAMGQLYQDQNSLRNMKHNRETSKEENRDAMEQAEIAIATMKKAMKILTKMSLRTKHKEVFLQITKAKPYHGHQEGHSNVMSMLEVLLDRFQKSYDELQSQEKMSQGDFNDMKAELSARIAANQQRATGTSRKTVAKVGEFTRLKADLRSQNAILTSA